MNATQQRMLNLAMIGSTVFAMACVFWRLGIEQEIPQPTVSIRTEPTWAMYATGEPTWGEGGSQVRVIQFASFTCSISESASAYVVSLPERFGGAVSVTLRHAGLGEDDSFSASLLSHCADRQGRFHEMHDALFARRDEIGRTPWSQLALNAGIPDTASINACMLSGDAPAVIAADTLAAFELGVRAIPTFLINDRLVEGFPGEAVMDSLISVALEESRVSRLEPRAERESW